MVDLNERTSWDDILKRTAKFHKLGRVKLIIKITLGLPEDYAMGG